MNSAALQSASWATAHSWAEAASRRRAAGSFNMSTIASASAAASAAGTARARSGAQSATIADRGADDRHARRRGLERHDARGFMAGRQHEQMGSTVECGDLVAGSAPWNVTRPSSPWRLTASRNAPFIVSSPARSRCTSPSRSTTSAKGLDECAMIFHRVQARDVQQAPGRAAGRLRRRSEDARYRPPAGSRPGSRRARAPAAPCRPCTR